MNMVTIPAHQLCAEAPTSYTRATTTTSAYSDDTDGTAGTCNGSPTPFMSSLPLSAIKITSFDRDKGNRYSEWLRLRIEFDSIFDTPTYAHLTAKDQIALIVYGMGPDMQNV